MERRFRCRPVNPLHRLRDLRADDLERLMKIFIVRCSRHCCRCRPRCAGLCQDAGPLPAPAAAQDKTLTVFAAASMKNALDDIDAAYTAKTGVKIIASYAASSALAKQIEQGAPADVFVSADTDWMDYAIEQEEHQRADPRQSARQQHRADRAEGFQDRQRHDRTGLRSRQARRRRQDRDRRRQVRARSANTPRRRWKSSAHGPRPNRNSRWRRACAPR